MFDTVHPPLFNSPTNGAGSDFDLWEQCVSSLKNKLSRTAFDVWIAPLTVSHLESRDAGFYLWCVCPYKGKIDSTLALYQADVEAIASKIQGASVEWVLIETVDHKNTDDDLNEKSRLTGQLAAPLTEQISEAHLESDRFAPRPDLAALEMGVGSSGLSARLVFDHFVIGKANQLAHAAAQHVAEQPGTAYNPFFLYGGVGLGKTHLIHAIGNQVLKSKPSAKIRYIHANQFVADVVGSYRNKTFDAFKQYYHSLDLLLIDDVQFFAGKQRTQEEFFYAFETLVANRSQIILTSDTYPKDLADFEARLVSRFTAGLTTAIEPPEFEMRVAILHEKSKTMGLALDDDVAFFIAKSLRSNVRELEGALHKLVAYSRFQSCAITLELAKIALRDTIATPRNVLSVDNIQKVVADYYKVKVSELQGKRRLAGFVLPRQVAMYLAKELTQRSLPDIGENFGGRDHTTVLHAVRKIGLERQNNAGLNHQIHVIEQTLKA